MTPFGLFRTSALIFVDGLLAVIYSTRRRRENGKRYGWKNVRNLRVEFGRFEGNPSFPYFLKGQADIDQLLVFDVGVGLTDIAGSVRREFFSSTKGVQTYLEYAKKTEIENASNREIVFRSIANSIDSGHFEHTALVTPVIVSGQLRLRVLDGAHRCSAAHFLGKTEAKVFFIA